MQSDAPDGLRGASTAVNFTLSDELRELVQEVHSFVCEDVRPVDAALGGDDRIEARWVWKAAVFLDASYGRWLQGRSDDEFFARLGAGVSADRDGGSPDR